MKISGTSKWLAVSSSDCRVEVVWCTPTFPKVSKSKTKGK